MRLCVIGKYPPIQGGVSQDTFWTTYALSRMGHDVHVVTNAPEVEAAFRIQEEPYEGCAGGARRPQSPVRVHPTSRDAGLLNHIPFANPYVSKLAGTAAQVIADHGPFDLIYAYYLEPYGVAAQLASAWTGVPFGLRHAGSDISRLFRHDGLHTTYSRMAVRADYWLAGGLTHRGLRHLGVAEDAIHRLPRYSVPTEFYHPHTEPLDIAAVQQRLGPARTFDRSLPTIGIYGKVGATKGTYDLVRGVAAARRRTGDCNLVVVASGPGPGLHRLGEFATELDIADRLTVLPFMPPWQIAGLVATCDAVAFLERDFPVSLHRPRVPREILACGGCLILSREVARTQSYAGKLRDRGNCLLVDPRDHADVESAVSFVIADPARARKVGGCGHAEISQELEDWQSYVDQVSGKFQAIAADIETRRTAMTMAETQAALARLYVDEAYRAWFAHAPDEALQKYSLTDTEKDTLKAVDKKMVRMFAASLRNKRRERALVTYPLLTKVCGEEVMARYFDRYYDLHPAQPGTSFAAESVAVGRYLVESLAVEALIPPYVAEVGRYELTVNEIRMGVWSTDDLRLLNGSAAPRRLPEDARPVLAPGVSVLRFEHDIPDILTALERGETRPEYPRKPTCVVVRPSAQGPPEVLKINELTADLLALCSGYATIAGIGERLQARRPSGTDLGPALRGALENLWARNIIASSSDNGHVAGSGRNGSTSDE